MTVIEIEPSGGYWTEILAPYLQATGGRYIAPWAVIRRRSPRNTRTAPSGAM